MGVAEGNEKEDVQKSPTPWICVVLFDVLPTAKELGWGQGGKDRGSVSESVGTHARARVYVCVRTLVRLREILKLKDTC